MNNVLTFVVDEDVREDVCDDVDEVMRKRH